MLKRSPLSIAAVLGSISLLLLPLSAVAQQDAAARINHIEGSVTVQRAVAGESRAAQADQSLTSGDRLWTDSGARAELVMAGGVYVWIDQQSTVDFLEVSGDQQRSGADVLRLWTGSLIVRVPVADSGSSAQFVLRIDAPYGSAVIGEPGQYRLDIGENQVLWLSAYYGSAELVAAGSPQRLRAGERSYAISEEAPSVAESFNTAELDDFGAWQDERYVALVGTERFVQEGGNDYTPRATIVYGGGPYYSAPYYTPFYSPYSYSPYFYSSYFNGFYAPYSAYDFGYYPGSFLFGYHRSYFGFFFGSHVHGGHPHGSHLSFALHFGDGHHFEHHGFDHHAFVHDVFAEHDLVVRSLGGHAVRRLRTARLVATRNFSPRRSPGGFTTLGRESGGQMVKGRGFTVARGVRTRVVTAKPAPRVATASIATQAKPSVPAASGHKLRVAPRPSGTPKYRSPTRARVVPRTSTSSTYRRSSSTRVAPRPPTTSMYRRPAITTVTPRPPSTPTYRSPSSARVAPRPLGSSAFRRPSATRVFQRPSSAGLSRPSSSYSNSSRSFSRPSSSHSFSRPSSPPPGRNISSGRSSSARPGGARSSVSRRRTSHGSAHRQ